MSTELARREEAYELDTERQDLLRKTVATDLTEPEFGLFVEYVRRVQLDPFRRQIYAFKVDGKMTMHVGIDGLRLIAERSGEYEGQEGPWWCGPDGEWKDVWLESTPPAAARVVVHRTGRRPTSGVARYVEYMQTTTYQGKRVPRKMWQQFPSVMLAKCAEAVAIRRAFPAETSGLYVSVDEETGEVSDQPRVLNPDAPATDHQKGELHRLARAMGWDDDERHARAEVDSFRYLKKGRASDLIDEWARIHDESATSGEVMDDGHMLTWTSELVEDSEPVRAEPRNEGPQPGMGSEDPSGVDVAFSPDAAAGGGEVHPSSDPPPPPPIDRATVFARIQQLAGSRPRMIQSAIDRFQPKGSFTLDDLTDQQVSDWLADMAAGKENK